MEVKAIVERLQRLAQNLSDRIQLEQQLSSLQKRLQHEENQANDKLNQFDSMHKDKYISKKAGEMPKKPNKALAIILPVFTKKKKEYDAAVEKRKARIKAAENEYYSAFEGERRSLIEAYNKEREAVIEKYSLSIDEINGKLDSVNSQIENEEIVGASMKNLSDIQLLVEIFDNKRADSIKEAVNVILEDEHRKRMEELQAEQVRLAKEAKEAAEHAEECAIHATEVARGALDRADEACDAAQDAYREAQEAHELGMHVFNIVMRNS